MKNRQMIIYINNLICIEKANNSMYIVCWYLLVDVMSFKVLNVYGDKVTTVLIKKKFNLFS